MITFIPASAVAELAYTSGPDYVRVTAPQYEFSYDIAGGTWDARWPDGKPMITRGYATWEIDVNGGVRTVASGGPKVRKHKVRRFIDAQDQGVALDVRFIDDEARLRLEYQFRFYDNLPYFTLRCAVKNLGVEPVSATHLTPLRTDWKRRGGLFVGADPAATWVLENGHKMYFDFWVRMIPGSESVHSNWNAAVYDPGTGRALTIGFATFDKAFVEVLSQYRDDQSLKHEDSGWQGFTGLRTLNTYTPHKSILPSDTLHSELLVLSPDMKSPHRSLEAFADAVAGHNPTPFRGKPVPTGWNAWATSLHHDLTQDNMLENAKWAFVKLSDFGMGTFQIDDGWMKAHGDWMPDEHFPEGMKWIADQIRDEYGFTPGLWIMPFCANENSRLAKEHPDWFAPKSMKTREIAPADWLILDPTHPDAAQWLHDLFDRISHEWGFKVIKIDFIYYLLTVEKFHDPDVTAIEAFRRGLEIIREAAGDDAFLIEVGVPVYTAAGMADGMRLGLDIIPAWADEEGPMTQGIKPLLRNLARRYYLNRRVWINHPDMFYLGSDEETERWGQKVTLDEARMYGTAVALSGAITKIGDQFVNLAPEQTDFLRKLLPVYDGAARPLDLFEMEYPQVWSLPVRALACEKQDASQCPAPWHAVGAFNWGRNRRWGEPVPEEDTVVNVNLADLETDPDYRYLVYGFWTGKFYGEYAADDVVEVPLAPRKVDVLAVRKSWDVPQFLSTNRHVTQGGTSIIAERWNPKTSTLEIEQDIIGGFPYELAVYSPRGFVPLQAEVNGIEVNINRDGLALRLQHKSRFNGTAVWKITFRREK